MTRGLLPLFDSKQERAIAIAGKSGLLQNPHTFSSLGARISLPEVKMSET
jgi:hypothetical protein